MDIVKWSINHLQPALQETVLSENMPKFLWYGDANKSQSYFIYYLLTIGCDIVMVHPNGEDILEKVKLDKELFFSINIHKEKSLKVFLQKKEKEQRQ